MAEQTRARTIWVRVGHVALTFVLFSLLNLVGSWFETEPGVSILFPATAVSIVATMWFGWWAAIGVFLGTIATPWGDDVPFRTLLISGVICSLEGLIPWAVFRIKRDLTPDLRDVRSLVVFLLFGSVVNTAISAVLGILFIVPATADGSLNTRAAVFWWVGGFTASLLLATPLLAFGGQFLDRRASAHRPRTLTNSVQIVTAILLLGFAASFGLKTYLLTSVEQDRITAQQRISTMQERLNALHDNFATIAYGASTPTPAMLAHARDVNELTIERLTPVIAYAPIHLRTDFTRLAAETVSWFEQKVADPDSPAADRKGHDLSRRMLRLRSDIDRTYVASLQGAELARERIVFVTTLLDSTMFVILLLASATLLVNVSRPFAQLRDALGSLREGAFVDTARVEAPYQELRTVAAALSDASRTLRQREAELKEQTDAALNASRHKTDFLAKMSHELRTPLNSILGFTELLIDQEGVIQPAKRLAFLDNVNTSAKHLLKLINDLLDIAKIESGKFELHIEPIDLRYAISHTVASTSALFVKKKQDLDVVLPDEPMNVYGDLGRIEQVLLNLLSNAHKFSPEGERITVRGRNDGTTCRIEVADRGIGIGAEDRGRIFGEFEQVETRGGEHSTGTGLGLALAQKFVQAHGGTLSVESEPGRGSIFAVTLPRRTDDASFPG